MYILKHIYANWSLEHISNKHDFFKVKRKLLIVPIKTVTYAKKYNKLHGVHYHNNLCSWLVLISEVLLKHKNHDFEIQNNIIDIKDINIGYSKSP